MRSFKRVLSLVIILVICIAVNSVLNYLLIPNNYVRNDIHNITTREYDDVFLGTSHGFAGIDPETVDVLSGRRSINLCRGGEYTRDSYYMLKLMCEHHVPERVVYEFDPSYWTVKDTQQADFTLIYREMPMSKAKVGYLFAKAMEADFRFTLFPWFAYRKQAVNIREIVAGKQTEDYKTYGVKAFDSPGQAFQPNGFMYRKRTEEAKKPMDYEPWSLTHMEKNSLKYFVKLAKYCKAKDIELITVTTPIPDVTYQSCQSLYDNAFQYFDQLTDQFGIQYYNFNDPELTKEQWGLCDFADYEGHMYGDRAKVFSRELAEVLFSKNRLAGKSDSMIY